MSLVAKFPFFMFVPNSSPAKTVEEFVAIAKAHPDKLIMAHPGPAAGRISPKCCSCKWRNQDDACAYRGAAPAFIDLIPGRINCYFGSGELLTYSRSGQVRVLGSSGAKSSPAAPDVPTIAEPFPATRSNRGRAFLRRPRRRPKSCKK